jgi:threonine aldolase
MKTFASDNYSGVHPEVMNALARANHGHAGSYGNDEYTKRTVDKFKDIFGKDIDVFFVYNGTGANVLGLSSLTQPFHSILCSEHAHILVDESTAPETFTGCRLVPVPSRQGKISPDELEKKIQRVGDQHHPQPRVVSLSQATEYATVYHPDEVKAISTLAKKNNLYLHMDGARIANAAVYLDQEFSTFTRDAGVDVLSFGGTKNGMMFGEAVIFFNTELAKSFIYRRKQGMQLHSKTRFIAAQFEALLSTDLWKRNAGHANAMAALLAREVSGIKGVTITQPVEANGVFATLPAGIITSLQHENFFYIWNEARSEVRWMCSWDTTEEDVKTFSEKLRKLVS